MKALTTTCYQRRPTASVSGLALAAAALCLSAQSLAGPSLQQRYDDSVKTAQRGQLPSKVLVPIPGDRPAIRVVTWMPKKDILVETKGTGRGLHHKAARDIWVTLEAEIQPRCRQFTAHERMNLSLRIRQLLGLPPDFGGTVPGGFQILEVTAPFNRHIFRPCKDPDPYRTACPSPISPGPNLKISPDHRAWFQQNYEASFVRGRFPWTQLGYTFDWAGNEEFYGISEYIVPRSTPIKLLEWVPLEKFCQAA